MSLPPGTKVQGKRAAYIVQNLICMSERSVTVGCKSEDGRNWRLKFYNGESCVTEAALMALVSNPVKGVILPVDMGVFSGSPFAVFANVQARNAASFPIAQDVLTRKIIPQLAYVMNQYHRKRILLRDMCPEHILYDISKQQIAYCGLNNAARVPKNATITKAKGCGQHHSFVAPEVEKYGYSTCSDYYSLGMTLLCLVRGKIRWHL